MPSARLTTRPWTSTWAEQPCGCLSMPSPPDRETRTCPLWWSSSVSRPKPQNEENSRQAVRTLDVPLGNPADYFGLEPHRAPCGVGLRLAAGICANLRFQFSDER